MIKKTLGYVLSAVGILLLLFSYQQVRAVFNIPALNGIASNTLLLGGVILVVMGIIILAQFGSFSKKYSEVPIYHGKDVVGFRKIKK